MEETIKHLIILCCHRPLISKSVTIIIKCKNSCNISKAEITNTKIISTSLPTYWSVNITFSQLQQQQDYNNKMLFLQINENYFTYLAMQRYPILLMLSHETK